MKSAGNHAGQFDVYKSSSREIKYDKIVRNPDAKFESVNSEFLSAERVLLLASSIFVKKNRKWLVVNVPARRFAERIQPMNSQYADSVDESGNPVYLTKYTLQGGLFIYDLKNRTTVLDLAGSSVINSNKNGLLYRNLVSDDGSVQLYSLIDWQGNYLFKNIPLADLLKDHFKLKLIAGNGNADLIYKKELKYFFNEREIINNEASGFHFRDRRNKYGYFSFSGHHL